VALDATGSNPVFDILLLFFDSVQTKSYLITGVWGCRKKIKVVCSFFRIIHFIRFRFNIIIDLLPNWAYRQFLDHVALGISYKTSVSFYGKLNLIDTNYINSIIFLLEELQNGHVWGNISSVNQRLAFYMRELNVLTQIFNYRS